jgi:hypothetical protein
VSTTESTRAKLRPEIKQRWLEALRSGRYEQGGGRLRDRGDHYCVLGVLCDLAVEDEQVTWEPAEDDFTCGSFVCFPPPRLRAWAWEHYSSEVENHLFNLNDGNFASFTQIADYIEANL